MDRSDPDVEAHYQASLRLACAIPTEIMYKMTECAGLLAELADKGGLQKVWQVFGQELDGLMSEMNEELVA